MAFIIISSKGAEIGRRGLVGGITVGRAPDCDFSIHDILLSRHHCRIQPSGRGWVVLDLRSKNGTWLDGERVGRRSLRHGEVVRAGNTTLRFMMGELPAGPGKPHSIKLKPRPADPFEAMTGTIVDFDASGAEEKTSRPRTNSRMPYPRPMPREPISYAQDGVYSLLEQIASSSWDSIYANASRPTRPAPAVARPAPACPELVEGAFPELVEQIHSAGPAAPSLKRPAVPVRRPPFDAAAMAAPGMLPLRSGSRPQVDFSLQAQAARAPRAVRAPLTHPDFAFPARAVRHRPPKRKSLARRAWHAIGSALAQVRRRIAPPGAVMLF